MLRGLNLNLLGRQLAGLVMLSAIAALLAVMGCLAQPATSASLYGKSIAPGVFYKPVVVRHKAPAKTPTSKSAPAAAPVCDAPQAENAVDFAGCASLYIDFSKQHGGAVSDQQFNIYVGPPEANGEAQLYTANYQNVRIQGGNLVLQAQNDPQQGFNYTSGRISTKGKEDFLYGKLVVRATIPAGIGTWPAIWLLPSQPRYASNSPVDDPNHYLNDGEIDIAEAVGTDPHRIYGIAHSVDHHDPDTADVKYFDTQYLPDNDHAFHDYGVEWTPSYITFTIDGSPYFTLAKRPGSDYKFWPYDQPYYLVLNVALGGTWGGVDTHDFPGDGVDKASLPAAMQVQSIRYYPYIGPR